MATLGMKGKVELSEELSKVLPCRRCGNQLHLQESVCPKCIEFDPFYLEKYRKMNGRWIVMLLVILHIYIGGSLYSSIGFIGIGISGVVWFILAFIIEHLYKNKRKAFKKKIEQTYRLTADEYKAWNYYMRMVRRQEIFD